MRQNSKVFKLKEGVKVGPDGWVTADMVDGLVHEEMFESNLDIGQNVIEVSREQGHHNIRRVEVNGEIVRFKCLLIVDKKPLIPSGVKIWIE